MVYNTRLLTAEELPDGLTGFAAPEWKGRIGWAPGNASFQTMATAMRTVWGTEKTLMWLLDIQANEPIVYPDKTIQVAAAASGEIDVGLAGVSPSGLVVKLDPLNIPDLSSRDLADLAGAPQLLSQAGITP